MLEYFSDEDVAARVDAFAWEMIEQHVDPNSRRSGDIRATAQSLEDGPLPNVWLGVSVEDCKRKDRIDLLRQTPAEIRFVSFEPLIEDLGQLNLSSIHWAIWGGESGPDSRPLDIAWIRNGMKQADRFKVPNFVKQLGADPYKTHDGDFREGGVMGTKQHLCLKDRKGGNMDEWPSDLRVREYPTHA